MRKLFVNNYIAQKFLFIEAWKQRYGSRNDIQFVGIHTVFEGHSYQTHCFWLLSYYP